MNLLTDARLREISRFIVEKMWEAFGPEVEELFFQQIIRSAAEKWRFRWEHQEMMSTCIKDATEELIRTAFKPALDKIAMEKARKKVKEKADKNNVELPQELLFPDGQEAA